MDISISGDERVKKRNSILMQNINVYENVIGQLNSAILQYVKFKTLINIHAYYLMLKFLYQGDT